MTADQRQALVDDLTRKTGELADHAVLAGAFPHEALMALEDLIIRLEHEGWRMRPTAIVLAAIQKRLECEPAPSSNPFNSTFTVENMLEV